MLKRISLFVLTCLITVFCLNISEISADSIKEAPEIKIMIDGKICVYNDVPIKVNGSIFLPLRELLLSLGVQDDAAHIIWNAEEGSLTINKGSTKVVLKSSDAIANVNGSDVKLDAPPINYKNKLYIAVGFVTKCYDRPVKWDASASTLTIEKAVKGDYWTSKQNLPFAIEPVTTTQTISGSNGSITKLVNIAESTGMAVTLGNKIYAINNIGKVAEYDPTLDVWTEKNSIPMLKNTKGIIKLTGINDKIYIVGNNINEILEYDPATNHMALATKLASDKVIGGAVAVNGKIYVLGGVDSRGNSLDTVEMYDPVTGKWAVKSKMLSSSSSVTLTTMNGKIYILSYRFDSAFIDEYDPDTDSWKQIAEQKDLSISSSMEAANGKIYMLHEESSGNRVIEYDPITDKWSTQKSGISRPRRGANTVTLNGKIYVIGGYENISETIGFAGLNKAEWDKRFDELMKGNTIRVLNYVDEYTPPTYVE